MTPDVPLERYVYPTIFYIFFYRSYNKLKVDIVLWKLGVKQKYDEKDCLAFKGAANISNAPRVGIFRDTDQDEAREILFNKNRRREI